MEKKFMNKLEDMEMDMVAGGRMQGAAPDNRPDDSYFNDFCKFVKNGAESVGSAFGRFFRMARTRSM
ncbi:hypothetical protein [Selenomonas ruminantium]|uniref:Uncharacterized protein n=1 Tax=Selenomonas ruminantium TaxID=971 RepID=A0A1K1MKG0_SELRU|nr:hypothetical protein [Selenomonas ruminantium]SFW23640.1 hypothetical protein SAMN02910323_0917 [Selenomonas ruminantium]